MKIKIVSSLVAISGDIDFDFNEKSQYFNGKHIRNISIKIDVLIMSIVYTYKRHFCR